MGDCYRHELNDQPTVSLSSTIPRTTDAASAAPGLVLFPGILSSIWERCFSFLCFGIERGPRESARWARDVLVNHHCMWLNPSSDGQIPGGDYIAHRACVWIHNNIRFLSHPLSPSSYISYRVKYFPRYFVFLVDVFGESCPLSHILWVACAFLTINAYLQVIQYTSKTYIQLYSDLSSDKVLGAFPASSVIPSNEQKLTERTGDDADKYWM